MLDLRALLLAYGLTDATVTLIGARANTTYRVEHREGCYLLRVHGIAGIGVREVTSELQFLDWLRDEVPFPIQRPIANSRGEWATSGGSQTASLLTWTEGEIFDIENLTLDSVREVGAMVGALHRAARRFEVPPRWIRPSIDSSYLLDTVFGVGQQSWRAANEHQRRLLHEAKTLAQAAEKELRESPTAFGLIHGDLHFKNMIRSPLGLVSPIDFDDMGEGFFVYDLAVVTTKLSSFTNYEPLRDALLEGYSSVASLNDIGLHLLPVWMMTRTAFAASWMLGNLSTCSNVTQTATSSPLNTLFETLEKQLSNIST